MATSTHSHAQHGYDPANYYVWPTPGGFGIHISLHIVRELTAQAGKEEEGRGILLGRSLQAPLAATIAEDFVVIPPAHDFEQARYAAEHDGRDLNVIGYFRWQRDGRLRLGQRDVQTFERLFYEDGNIGLLIRAPRRGESEAALYYWQYGIPQPREFGFGFPMDAEKLAGGHPGWRFPEPVEPEVEAPPRSASRRKTDAPPVSGGERIRWSRLVPTAVLVVAGIVVTQVAWNAKGMKAASATQRVETPAAAPAPEKPAAPAIDPALGLRVTTQPHQLEIRWNRAAPTIAAAAKGTMSISEAGVTESVPFDPQQLHDGYVAYTPKTNDVSVRFEVTGADGVAKTESIRVVAIP